VPETITGAAPATRDWEEPTIYVGVTLEGSTASVIGVAGFATGVLPASDGFCAAILGSAGSAATAVLVGSTVLAITVGVDAPVTGEGLFTTVGSLGVGELFAAEWTAGNCVEDGPTTADVVVEDAVIGVGAAAGAAFDVVIC